ncbi:MAG: hypothetical protein ACOZAN_05200 [Patescibacteria group bacterium]
MHRIVYGITKATIKVLLLFLLINWDKVIGLPISFFIASLFLLNRRELGQQLWLFIVQTVLLAGVFAIPLVEAGLVLFVGYNLWTRTKMFKLARFFWLCGVSLLFSVLLGFQLGIASHLWIYLGVLSSLLVVFTIRKMRRESLQFN